MTLGTDYWVSQGRKFCEFCKCSIADNKPSIQFHENGKKHKENVAKKLAEMRKKATKEAKTQDKFNKELKKMENAALQAYLKDIETAPDFASESIRKAVAEAEREKEEKAREREEKKRAAKVEAEKAKLSKTKSSKKWMEGINEDGKKYYYHLNTGETVDEPPAAGYVSLAEQEWKREKREKKMNKNSVAIKNEEIYRPEKQVRKIVTECGPAPKSNHPYGAWQKVDPEPEPVDLQLPERPELVPVAVPSISDDSDRKFKQKKIPTPGTIESLEGETSFKKRKFVGNPKRNMRQRLNDE